MLLHHETSYLLLFLQFEFILIFQESVKASSTLSKDTRIWVELDVVLEVTVQPLLDTGEVSDGLFRVVIVLGGGYVRLEEALLELTLALLDPELLVLYCSTRFCPCLLLVEFISLLRSDLSTA